jgi:hypothetical protein
MTTKERAALNELRNRVTATIADAVDCPMSLAIGMLIDLAAHLIARSVPSDNVEAVTAETVRVLRLRIALYQYETERQEQDSPSNLRSRQ